MTATDARGRTVATGYDALGRKTEQRTGIGDRVPAGHLVVRHAGQGAAGLGHQLLGGNAYTVAVTGYNAAGRATGSTVTIPAASGPAGDLAGTYTTTTQFRVDGSPSSAALPALGDIGPETVDYGYDDYGKAATVTGYGDYVTDTGYTRFGEPARIQFGDTGSRLWQSFYYDTATRRPTETLTEREAAQGSPTCSQAQQASCTTVDDTTYGYDPAGNVTQIADAFAGSATDTQCFHYDYLRELTDAWTTTASCSE